VPGIVDYVSIGLLRDRVKFLENGIGGGDGAENMKKRTLEISDWGSLMCPQRKLAIH